MRWRRGLFTVAVAAGVLVGAAGCAPSARECVQAHQAHVHVTGCR